MKPNAGKGDSEAPGSERVAGSATPSLEHANLLRVRRLYEEAKRECLRVLEQNPHDVESLTLLGDIHAEDGDADAAQHWYGMALEHVPDSSIIKEKVEHVRLRAASRQRLQTATELGIPQNDGTRTFLLAFGALAVIAMSGVIAYSLGQRNPNRNVVEQIVRDSITATAPAVHEVPVDEPAPEEPKPELPVPTSPKEDIALLARLSGGPVGSRLVSASLDPRAKHLTLTFTLAEGDDERKVAADLGREALAAEPEASLATLRATRSNSLVYVADVSRARLDESSAPEWIATNGDGDAWVGHVLSNEWRAEPDAQRP